MDKMDRDDELALLRKRKDELDTISSNLHDIKKWFDDNEIYLVSDVDSASESLESAIDFLDDVLITCDCAIDMLEENEDDED
jgi:hypothetical protein